MRLTGDRFTRETAAFGNDLSSWSTLVLLEWIRRRGVAPVIHPALLTEVAHELLPIAVVDYPCVRVMSWSPSLTELQAWFRSVWPLATTRRLDVGSELPPRTV